VRKMMSPTHTVEVQDPVGTSARSGTRYLRVLAVCVVVLVTMASLLWSHDHPYGFNWDEALYLGQMQTDVSHFHQEGLRGLARGWLKDDPVRPPAYRVLAAPFALLLGPSPFVLRSVAIFARVLTLSLLYFGVGRVGGRDAAAFAVIFLALCPDIVFFGTIFYNECALYLATAGVCFFVLRCWDRADNSMGDCLGLGAFLAMGALAKASFLSLVGVFLLTVLFFRLRRKIAGPSPLFLLCAGVVGGLLSAPWWLRNIHSALNYVKYAMNFSRDTTGPLSIGSAFRFILRFMQEGIGLPMACLCMAILIVVFVSRSHGRPALAANSLSLAAICTLLAPLPTCVMPLLTHNQVMYHISQSLVFFACAFALLAESGGWFSSPGPFLVLNLAVLAQLALTLTPVVLRSEYPGQRFAWTALGRWDQWDWNEFRILLRAQRLEHPSIAYLGGGGGLNPAQIIYPWLSHGEQPPQVSWLWREENGAPDLSALVATASTNDVVFTVPDPSLPSWSDGLQDSHYNAEFAKRINDSSSFQSPLHLRLGRFHPADVWIFIRKPAIEK
jgi:hypothetical protein